MIDDVFREHFGCWAKNRQETRAGKKKGTLRRLLKQKAMVTYQNFSNGDGKKYSYSGYILNIEIKMFS